MHFRPCIGILRPWLSFLEWILFSVYWKIAGEEFFAGHLIGDARFATSA